MGRSLQLSLLSGVLTATCLPRLLAQSGPSLDSLLVLARGRQVFALARHLSADAALGDSLRACLLGQVHAAFRQTEEAVLQLRRCVDGETPPELIRRALEQLVPVYAAAGRTADAAQVLRQLLASYARGAAEDSAGWAAGLSLMEVMARAPPMRVSARGDSRVRTQRNWAGMQLVQVTVNGTPEEFLLDTGAGLSVIMESLASTLGIELVPGGVTVTGGTDVRMAARLGLGRLTVGNVALESVPFLVLPDSALYVRAGPLALQVRGIIGLPVLVALEEFSLSADGWMEIPAQPQLQGMPNLALDGQRLLVEATLNDARGVFNLDTGARSTTLHPSARWLLADQGLSGTPGTIQLGSAGGTRTLAVVRLPVVTIGVGGSTVTLRQLPLLDEAPSQRAQYTAGNLGQDVLGSAPLTLNLRSMIVRLAAANPE